MAGGGADNHNVRIAAEEALEMHTSGRPGTLRT